MTAFFFVWVRCYRIGFLFCILAFAAPAAVAQQSCLPATPEARAAVTRYLRSSSDMPWLRSRGVTAVQVEDLEPLRDATDAALCRRIDSTMRGRPAYFFRAGAYIIVTDARPAQISTTGVRVIPRRDHGSYVFVHDSSGRFINVQYLMVVAPPDVRATVALSGNVTLAWTNRSIAMPAYQLQRATGSGAFINLGPSIAGTATTTTDATAVSGLSYRYRVAASGSQGETDYSNVVNVALADIGTVTRTATGLLYRDQFDRADGAPGTDWVAESGPWTIVNNALQVNVLSGQSLILRLAAIPNRRDYHVQLFTSRSQIANYAPIQVRKAFNLMYQADLGSTTDASPNVPRLYRSNGWWNFIGVGSARSVANVPTRLTLSAIGNSLALWANGVRQVTATDAIAGWDATGHVALNAYGSGGAGTIRLDDVIICSDRTVTITGLPARHRLRVAGNVSLPTGTTGTVIADLFGVPLPVSQLEILDATDSVVKIHVQPGGVWGGDRYAFAATP